MNYYKACTLCPRSCSVDRTAGEKGYCGESDVLRIAAASLHCGEEPPLTGGGKGSGTIFVTGCNLGCRFCQNSQISQNGMGRAVTTEEFVFICHELARRGAANINIVTGSHAIPAIAEGLRAARKTGLGLPVLWNTSAYETVEALKFLDDCRAENGRAQSARIENGRVENGHPEHRLVDIWLPDLKTLDGNIARRYFAAPDYPEKAAAAIRFMLDRAPLVWEGIPFESALKRGVIIRHLVLPGMVASTREVLRWFAENARDRALLSLMTQYTPVTTDTPGTVPDRYLDEAENAAVLAMLDEFGIDDGFVQEMSPDDEWLPDFAKTNPFGSALSVPVWHWKTGIVPQ